MKSVECRMKIDRITSGWLSSIIYLSEFSISDGDMKARMNGSGNKCNKSFHWMTFEFIALQSFRLREELVREKFYSRGNFSQTWLEVQRPLNILSQFRPRTKLEKHWTLFVVKSKLKYSKGKKITSFRLLCSPVYCSKTTRKFSNITINKPNLFSFTSTIASSINMIRTSEYFFPTLTSDEFEIIKIFSFLLSCFFTKRVGEGWKIKNPFKLFKKISNLIKSLKILKIEKESSLIYESFA